jgi:hypothetical protein
MSTKKWYDDWKLSLTGWDDGSARIDVELPHNNPPLVRFATDKDHMQQQANIIDKLLSELTHTKVNKVITDGRNTPPPAR